MKSADMGRRGWKIAVSLTGAILLAAGLLYFYFQVYQVTPAFSEATYEYGDRISQDISDYLTGTAWSVQLGELDLSRVDEDRAGIYEAVVYHGRHTYRYKITIQDTVAPEILWKEGQVYLAMGADCTVEDVIDGISDVDARAEALFYDKGETAAEISFDQTGQYEVEILARDRAGNETRGEVSVIVDTPPVIEGVRRFYVTPGEKPDYREAVTARDDLDGELTGYIRVDDSEVKLDQSGSYPLRYVVEDGYGLETTEETRILVAGEDALQEMIGRREIDYRTDVIMGAPNIYDAGVSDHEDMEETLDYMRPALVQLYHSVGGGGYSSGSGYIMEISEDTVYICSNNHVVEKYDDWDIYFYDGTCLEGRKLGTSEVYDVGVVEVALEDVPAELLNRLMTVHIDRSYWESLDQEEIALGLERVDRKGGLLHTSTGNLIRVKQEFAWNDHMDHTEVNLELVRGDSGSAILDGYGNLIGMAYAYSTDPIRYWCVPLDGILDCYEEITGRTPYVY